jgi:LysM repeat protein
MIKYIILIAILTSPLHVFSQNRSSYTREEYIHRYKDMAIAEMQRSGVPASIKLAQGMLESGNGGSRLATRSNNHFGIKCHNWEGRKTYHDDDKKNECFRVYPSVEASFRDHSEFLLTRDRYRFLFDLNPTDYSAWAHGLRKAGYATNSKYPELLIRIIEENQLYLLDQGVDVPRVPPTTTAPRKRRGSSGEDFVIDLNRRKVETRNRVEYIRVKEGDTFESLTTELQLLRWELTKYNDLSPDSALRVGQELYIQPKRRKAEAGNSYHIVKKGETMHQVSQLYAIKLQRLYRLNEMVPGMELKEGATLWLRSRKR